MIIRECRGQDRFCSNITTVARADTIPRYSDRSLQCDYPTGRHDYDLAVWAPRPCPRSCRIVLYGPKSAPGRPGGEQGWQMANHEPAMGRERAGVGNVGLPG